MPSISLRQPFTWESKEVQEVMTWWHQMFPDPELFEYTIKLISTTLSPKNNPEKKVLYMYGKGSNSMTSMINILQTIHGDKMMNMGNEWLNNDSPIVTGWSEKDHAIFRIEDSGVPSICRFNSPKSISPSSVKELVEFSFVIIDSNTLPNFTTNVQKDAGLARRMAIVPCVTTWSNEKNNKNDCTLDPTFSSKIYSLAPAARWILGQYYEMYLNQGLVKPAAVTNCWNKVIDSYNIPVTDHQRNNIVEVTA